MIVLRLALASLRNRRLTTALTLFSIALSAALLLSVERLRRGAEEGFTQSISQTDLIVGARGGSLNLLLFTVFNMGSATNNVSIASYDEWKKNPAVDWTIPYSLGDGHRGFRVVGTDANFYEHYRFRGDGHVELAEGERADGLWDVVLGADVARTLNYHLGQKIVVAHGVTSGEGVQMHDDKPFHVVGIMKPTGTALDRSLYVTLEGLEAIHLDWHDGAAPSKDKALKPEQIRKEDVHVDEITAFFVRTKSRIETLRLQRSINDYAKEPLLAIIPGVTLSELWHGLGYVEKTLQIISWLVFAVGMVTMLISLLTLLEQRRREMSILRALGAGPGFILGLLLSEAIVLTLIGLATGLVAEVAIFAALQGWVAREFGVYLVGEAISSREWMFLAFALVTGALIGVLPALRAFFYTLKDGLSVKG